MEEEKKNSNPRSIVKVAKPKLVDSFKAPEILT